MTTCKYKKWIKDSIFVISLLLPILLTLNWISKTEFPEEAELREQLDFAWHKISTADAITLGGSTSDAINFSALKQNAATLHYGGTDVFVAEALLKTYLPHANQLQVVYIAADPVMLSFDNQHFNSGIRRMYYRILPDLTGFQLIEGDLRNFLIANYLPLIREDNWRTPVYSLFNGILGDVTNNNDANNVNNLDEYVAHDEKIRGADQAYIGVFARKLQKVLYRYPDIPERAMSSLLRIHNMLASRGIQLVMYEPPVTQEYSTQMERLFKQLRPQFEKLRSLLKKNGAIVLDYHEDKRFRTNYELFKDSNHLNKRGELLFTEILMTDILKRH